MAKPREKSKAIKLRKRGYSYREILEKVPVAKSTLSLWLQGIGLAKEQKQRLSEKKLAAAIKGAMIKKKYCQALVKLIKGKARKEIGNINKRDLWMIGTALYWAEGTKEKHYRISEKVAFSNTDPAMIILFIRWLERVCNVSPPDITYELFIHQKANWRKAQRYWASILSISNSRIRVYFKKHKVKSHRKNIRESYHGLIKVVVKRSTNLNRKIAGWIEGIIQRCGVV